MKNQKKNYFSVFLSLILLITGSIFLNLPKQSKVANADTAVTPTYLTVYKNNKVVDGQETTYERTGDTGDFVNRNDAVFLSSNQVLIFRLAHPEEQSTNAIMSFNVQVFVNNQSLSNANSYIIDYPYPNDSMEYIEMILDLHKTSPDQEGKYNITISYMEFTNIDGKWTNALTKELAYTFYLYKTTTYYSAGLPAVSVSNVSTYLAGSSASYARTHEFNYTNNLVSSQRLSLPVIAYDTNKFELLITKNISGVNTESKVTVDASGNLVQTNPIVRLHKVDNTAYVTFNDIGTYYVQYLFLYNGDGTVEYFANINSQTRPDRVNLFGFQIYHADINSNISSARKEFKVFKTDNTLEANYQTDITYTQINNNYIDGSLITPVGNKYTVEKISNINFNGANLTVPSTNQAPVDFNYNASIIKNNTVNPQENSFYLKLDSYDSQSGKNLWTKYDQYSGTSFTDVGVYLVKITYNASISTQTVNYTQWFYFKITNETPSFQVLNSQNQEINSNTFTKDTISVQFNQSQNPFDSASALTVYSKSYTNNTYSNPVSVPYNEMRSFSANNNYRVVLQFGKNLTKSKISYFTIDNTAITGFTGRNVALSSGYQVKTSAVSFFTNQNVAVEWNEKQASGNTITAEYKFIPIVASGTAFSSTELQSYYEQGYFVPTPYYFDYGTSGQYPVLKTVPYTNTLSQTNNVSAEGIFTQAGMYIFHLVDKAGNELYDAFVIDKTNPVVLQKMTESGNYITDFSSLNLIAEDSIIQWGKYKAIKTNLNLSGIDFTSWTMIDGSSMTMDAWLLQILRNKARLSQQNDVDSNFKVVTVNTNRNLYLTPRIQTASVMVQIGQTKSLASATNYGGGALVDEYSYAITVAKTISGSLVLFENTYSFYVSDESKTDAGDSTIHTIQVSTDISKTSVRFALGAGNQNFDSLVKHSYEVVDTETSTKAMYFMPISQNILQLQYLIAPTENAIEVDKILVYYYPYISNYLIYRGTSSMLQTNMYYTIDEQVKYTLATNETQGLTQNNYYTLEHLISKNIFSYSQFQVGTSYVLAKTARLYTVYDYQTSANLGSMTSGFYVWDINTITNPATGQTQTQQGKYVVERTYRKLAGVEDIVGQRYDFMERTITFIVDREDVVSSAITLNINPDPNGTPNEILISQVGGASYIEVLAGSGKNENIFKELYRARNYDSSSGGLTNILETNKLPVKVSIPLFKFGQLISDNFVAFSNNLFFTSAPESYISSFEMQIQVKHLSTNTIQTQTYTLRLSPTVPTFSGKEDGYILLDNGLYLVTSGVTNGYIVLPTFSQVGQYEVNLSQNNANLKGNKSSLTFYMNIVNIAPVFEVEDTFGNALGMDSATQTYYTNKNTLRVVWTDSSNVFNAKIDVNKLVYFDGSNSITVPSNQVVTMSNGYTHYFDINIANYQDGTNITVILSYEGNSAAYPSGSYSTSKVVKIDRIAPVSSLNKLFAKADEPTIINANNLRQGHNQTVGYNRTTIQQDSIYRNFAFAVDISDFNSLIYSSTDKTNIYFRLVPNKYSDDSYVELDPSSETALTQLLYSNLYTPITKTDDYINLQKETYYEIAEIDFAGNITVYSIYLTDVANIIASEQALKNQNADYKNNINEDLKLVQYSTQINQNSFLTVLDVANANNSSKIFAKNNFTLQAVNAYGYPWAIVTYNNIKYLQSPKLDGTVYKLTQTGTTQVSLSTIALPLSRSNYTMTIKNMPKANMNLSVVVSSFELVLTQPTGTSETLSITRVAANDTEFVNWQTVEIYEYRNGADVKYAKFAKFVNGTSAPVSYEPEVEGYNLATYQTAQNITTFTVNALLGSHYRYKVTDNFGKIYTLHHLYGQEYVKPIINHDGLTTPLTKYEDGNLYYISNTGYTFTFFPSITTVNLTVFKYNTTGNVPFLYESINYTINSSTSTTIGLPYFTITKYASYYSINMTPQKEYNDRFEGVKMEYIVETTTNILSEEEDNLTEVETFRFQVYSLIPTTQLKGKNRQSLNDLLLNSTNLTSEPITVEFVNSSGYDYPVQFYVSFNNQSPILINSGTTFSASGTYTIIKRFTSLLSVFEIPQQTFTISDAASQFYTVVVYSQSQGKYVEIKPTGSPYLTDDSGAGTTIYDHYIVNTLDFKINVNASQYVEIVGAPGSSTEDATKYYTSIKRGISTYVRTISNFHAIGNPTVNYVTAQIAISYIPSTNKIANSFYYADSQGNQVNLTYSEKTYALEKDVDNASSVTVSWNNYYMIAENKVIAEIRYGSDNQLLDLSKIVTKSGVNSISLTRSGYYQFTFKDLAGNIHKFDYNAQIQNSTNTYDFIFLKNVIFTVNETSPIPYAIYNGEVAVAIPSYTINYYDSNARPQMLVERNGIAYTGYTSSNIERKYTFKEPGLYKLVFAAKRNGKQIKEESYYFEIIKSNEVANAFSIEEYEDYYIEKIMKDGVDVTRKLSTTDVGKLIYITKNNQTLAYLRNLFVSLHDEQTGAGIWEVTINTNNDLKQTFTYSFRINSVIPPISVSLGEGASTTDVITVNFNARNLYDEVGDSIIKIGSRQIVLNEAYFEENSQEIYSVEITDIGDTYIQILTPSGRLLYTYRVTREQPLNAVAIIIIIVGSLTAVGLTVMFVLLRRRMKIR